MNATPHKRFPWIWYLLALLVIGAFAFAPIGSVMLCGAIANTYECKVVSWLIFLILHRVAWRKRVSAGIPPPVPPVATA
jgi:hypothetical protein